MRDESIDGLVVRIRDYGDHDRYLSILTAQKGRITLLAKGSRSLKGQQTAVSQLYSYANFEYYRKGDFNILKGGALHNAFYALSMDIDRLDLAAYLCDLACEVTDEGEEAEQMLRLMLNSLYAISHARYPQEIIKGAVELRAAALSGYEPELGGCEMCGARDAEAFYLNVMNGSIICPECLKRQGNVKHRSGMDSFDDIREAEVLCALSPAVAAAIRYVIHAPIERIFSFELKDPDDLAAFAKTAETYILSHLGRGFDSLNFYHAMREAGTPVAHKETTV